MAARPAAWNYDLLLRAIYRGAIEEAPWHSTLPALRQALDAEVASLVLRPPSPGDPGFILNCVRPEAGASDAPAALADPNDWQVTAYREQFFSLDPFVNLPPERVVSLDDILPDEELVASDYYLHYLQPVNLFSILGVDTGEPAGLLARLRFSRRREEPRFSTAERELLARLTPHLHQALEIYARLNQMTSERDIYAGAVDQLAVATLILDARGRVQNTTALAASLLTEGDGIALRGNQLYVEARSSDRKWQAALAGAIRAQQAGETTVVSALRVPRARGRADLGLIVRPAAEWSEGHTGPCVAVFISDPDHRDPASRHTLMEIFELTPAEANVAILLARGLSLAEIAQTQNISPHTARAQLKSIFAKTGVSRQAELVRVIIRSVAALG